MLDWPPPPLLLSLLPQDEGISHTVCVTIEGILSIPSFLTDG